jgi:hypothetical protein
MMKICVVSHDAGGAEILASYVAQNNLDCVFVLDGPAIKVFERRIGRIQLRQIEDGIAECDWCLTGTSWQSDLEWRAIEQARYRGKKIVSFLDHWVNYSERFVREGVEQLPDEIWTGDLIAQDIASLLFPHLLIKFVNNPYFIDVDRALKYLDQYDKKTKSTGLKILYVCEPIAEHALKEYGNERYWGYTEYDALRYFLENITVLGSLIEQIVIRPHPSEHPDKYQWVREEFGDLIVCGRNKTLFEEINQSDIIVGCETIALVVGLIAKRRVISCIPHGVKLCALPQKEIEHWWEILQNHQKSSPSN